VTATTPFTAAVLAVVHPDWCDPALCMATADWDHEGTGFVGHRGRFFDVDELTVELVQGEKVSPQGYVSDCDPIAVQVEGVEWRDMAPALAERLAAAIGRAVAAAGGAR
jgi:hypothetical protein